MTYKKFTSIVFTSLIIILFQSRISYSQIDSEAVVVLDKMSDVITNLESCSFVLKIEHDIFSERLGLIKNSDISKVFLKAPDKLFVNKTGDGGDKSFYCDGKTFTYYSADRNHYTSIPALPTIMETIDSIHNEYGVDFPAADIFYPDFVDDLIEKSDNLTFLGYTLVEDKECLHVAGTMELLTYQIWITKADLLPIKIAIVYTSKNGNPQYEAIFNNWDLNPVLEDSMFDFSVPDGASKIIFKK